MYKRIFLIVVDSFGIGHAPDAADYGDEGSNTLRTIYRENDAFLIPTLSKMGLFNIDGVDYFLPHYKPNASYGRMTEKSVGKDTTTGHWELAGVVNTQPFDTFPNGFPNEFIAAFENEIGVKTLCNRAYSGTQVIDDYGEEHRATGKLIVYTSADSVLQIAADESVVPVETLYSYCKVARRLLDEKYRVGRVIARPFVKTEKGFVRTSSRHDFSILPPETMLDRLKDNGYSVYSVGKINDIFCGKGITDSLGVNKTDMDGMRKTNCMVDKDFTGLCFVNLVDADMLYGHRRDIVGYGECIKDIDRWMNVFASSLKKDDLLMITADHGCDPAYRGTDHTRECVPLLVYGRGVKAVNLGTRDSFADVSATILQNFNLSSLAGESFLNHIIK